MTRDSAIDVLTLITCAPTTQTIRGIRSEVAIGPSEGLPETCVISCDNLVALPKTALDQEPVGHLDLQARIELDQALRYALDIQY